MNNFLIIPQSLAETPISSQYLKVWGRELRGNEGINVLLVLSDGVKRQVFTLIHESWKKYDVAPQFDGGDWTATDWHITSYSVWVLLAPGRYSVEPKN